MFLCTLLAPFALFDQEIPSDASGATASTAAGSRLPDESTLLLTSNERSETGPASVPAVGVSAWDFIRMLLMLAAVVASIYVFFFLLKKAAGRGVRSSGLIRVVGSQTLSGNRAVHLVRIGNQVFLVGSADSAVGLIAEITDRETLDEIALEQSSSEPAEHRTFQELFSGLFSKGGAVKPQSGSGSVVDGSVDYMRRQQERLRKLKEREP